MNRSCGERAGDIQGSFPGAGGGDGCPRGRWIGRPLDCVQPGSKAAARIRALASPGRDDPSEVGPGTTALGGTARPCDPRLRGSILHMGHPDDQIISPDTPNIPDGTESSTRYPPRAGLFRDAGRDALGGEIEHQGRQVARRQVARGRVDPGNGRR